MDHGGRGWKVCCSFWRGIENENVTRCTYGYGFVLRFGFEKEMLGGFSGERGAEDVVQALFQRVESGKCSLKKKLRMTLWCFDKERKSGLRRSRV